MDIDTDFSGKNGPKMFQYLIDKYGRDHCCNIAAFGRLQIKMVIKDISKVYEIPFEEVNNLTRNIPDKDADGNEIYHVADLMNIPESKEFFDKYPEVLRHAKRLEGSLRHVSQHPAGIGITPCPITDLVPVQRAKEVEEGVEAGYLAQFEKDQVENSGIVKFDLLKLKNIDQIDDALKLVKQHYNKEITETEIPLDDVATWETLSRGDTLGVFQLASNTAIPVLRRVKPRNMEELSAINAFIRPGASGLDEYLESKLDSSKLRKLDPRLDKHLLSTYGALVYQEQNMALIAELMGISFGQADLYRRALEKPKKNPEAFERFKNEAVTLGVARGFKKEICELVRDLIIDNSGYSFNKSHSIAYSLISYATAWLKTNYPVVFYTVMFNYEIGKLSEYMDEAKKMGITIKPPHVCYSKYEATIEDLENKVIRIGLNTIKGLGNSAVVSILEQQPFSSINDFFERTNSRTVNKKVIESILTANALDDLPVKIEDKDMLDKIMPDDLKLALSKICVNDNVNLNSKQKYFWYDKYLEQTKLKKPANYAIPKQMLKGKYLTVDVLAAQEKDFTIVIPEPLLEAYSLKLEACEQYKTRKKPKGIFKEEAETSSFKLSPSDRTILLYLNDILEIHNSDLENYVDQLESFGYSFFPHPLDYAKKNISNFHNAEDGQYLQIAGLISGLEQRVTKNNKLFYYVFILTPYEKVRVTVWNEAFKKYQNLFEKNKLVRLRGTKGYGSLSLDVIHEITLKVKE